MASKGGLTRPANPTLELQRLTQEKLQQPVATRQDEEPQEALSSIDQSNNSTKQPLIGGSRHPSIDAIMPSSMDADHNPSLRQRNRPPAKASAASEGDRLLERIRGRTAEPKGAITNLNVQVTTALRKRIGKFLVMEDIPSLRAYITALIEDDLEKRGY